MIATLRPMNPFTLIPAAFLTTLLVAGAQQAQPDPAALLKGARMAAALVNMNDGLTGNLNKDGRQTPVALFLKGKNIQFQFSTVKNQWEIFHLRLDDDALNLFRIADGRTVDFPAAKLMEPIAGTDVTYEDLSMRFLYWPNAKIEAEEEVNGFPCYKLKVEKPKAVSGRYAAVYVWVSKKYGAFIRVAGYESKGGLVKEFQVIEVMPINDKAWGLKKMQVSTHDPANGRKISITNLVFDSPRKAPKPAGLR
jgi:hypothetical protein